MKIAALLSLLTIATITHGQPGIPELWGTPVHDEAGVLSADYIHRLEELLRANEDSTSNQIAVLIIRTLDGYPIEEFALQVSEKWKLGRAGKDNGVLLLVVTDDRKLRIEVGYGLEGVLPDALASSIIRNEIAPYFRRGDYEGGIQAGVVSIVRAIAGEYKADRPAARRGRDRVLILPLVVALIMIALLSRLRGGGRGGRRGGGWMAGPWLLGGGMGSGWSGGRGWSGGGGFSGGGGGFGGGGSSGSW